MVVLPEFAKQQVQPTLYSYNELKYATRDFHPDNKLGEGGFGVVYKVIICTSISAHPYITIYAVSKAKGYHLHICLCIVECILCLEIRLLILMILV
jgi:hypothetical protein